MLSCAGIVVLLLRGWLFFFRVGHMGMVSFCSKCKNWTLLTANTCACRRRLLHYQGVMMVWVNFIPLFWQSALCSWGCKKGLPEVRSKQINKTHWNIDLEYGFIAIMSVNIDLTESAVRSNLISFKKKKKVPEILSDIIVLAKFFSLYVDAELICPSEPSFARSLQGKILGQQ